MNGGSLRGETLPQTADLSQQSKTANLHLYSDRNKGVLKSSKNIQILEGSSFKGKYVEAAKWFRLTLLSNHEETSSNVASKDGGIELNCSELWGEQEQKIPGSTDLRPRLHGNVFRWRFRCVWVSCWLKNDTFWQQATVEPFWNASVSV